MLLLPLLAVPVLPLPAQEAEQLRGRVLQAPDSTGLADVPVVLHRIDDTGGAPVDTARTGPGGTFSFRLPAADSSAVFLATTRFQGVLYFGPAAHFGSAPDPYRIRVYPARPVTDPDSLVLRARTLVLAREGGALRVMDLVDVEGRAGVTLVSPDSVPGDPAAGEARAPVEERGGTRPRGTGAPWWSVALPEGAREPRVIRGGVDPESVELGEGEARIGAVVPPAGQRVALGYGVEDQTLVLGPRRQVRRFEVLVRNPGREELEVAGLDFVGTVESPQGPVERYRRSGLGAGDTVRIRLAGGAGPGPAAWGAIGAGVLLLVAAAWSWRRRSRPGSGGTPAT